MNTKNLLSAVTLSAVAISSAHSAILSVPDFSLTPNGTNDSPQQTYDFAGGVGANTIVKSSDPVAYFITTFTFGAGTSADLKLNFTASGGQDRLGIVVRANGTVSGSGDGADGPVDFDFGSSLAGETVVIIGKFQYDATFSDTYGESNASNDTFSTFWINPTGSSVEGSGLPDGYGSVANAGFTGDFGGPLWNSSQFYMMESRIFNNNTPGTAGDSIIQNTTLLTGSDATFANALAIATVPEPSSVALIGLSGLGLMLRRRRK